MIRVANEALSDIESKIGSDVFTIICDKIDLICTYLSNIGPPVFVDRSARQKFSPWEIKVLEGMCKCLDQSYYESVLIRVATDGEGDWLIIRAEPHDHCRNVDTQNNSLVKPMQHNNVFMQDIKFVAIKDGRPEYNSYIRDLAKNYLHYSFHLK